VHRVEISNTQEYLKSAARSASRNPFGDLILRVKARGGIVPLKYSKGDKIEFVFPKIKLKREDVDSSRRIH
jgi:hypothetical protein